MVTWTFGNMLSLAMPKDSGKARVEWEDFPLVPPPYLTVKNMKTDTGWNPDINALLQLKIIAKVLNACDTIIAATDASREGEMLFRHLYGFLGCKQPCLRLWISSLTDEAITEGMANLLPCDRFDNLFLAADSRNRADWLLGVNSSYAICKAVGFGNNSLGRVQTPVLAEICRRYRERENFLPADSWPVFVSLCKDRQIIKLRHTEDFQEYRYASELYGDCKAVRNARIAAVSRESEDIRAPAPYNLTELQKDANRYHNLTAIQVQDITQGLYEKKLISYPRTASRLLTRDVYDTLPAVMEKILSRKEFRQYAKMTDFAAPPSDISAQSMMSSPSRSVFVNFGGFEVPSARFAPSAPFASSDNQSRLTIIWVAWSSNLPLSCHSRRTSDSVMMPMRQRSPWMTAAGFMPGWVASCGKVDIGVLLCSCYFPRCC